jgi:hypothetical protein
MNNNNKWINVEVQLNTEKRISGELGDLLFNCGLEILQKDGKAIIVNQTDLVRINGDLYVAIGLQTKYVNSLETALSMLDTIDNYKIVQETDVVLIRGDYTINEPNPDEIKECAEDITSRFVAHTI